MGFPLACQSEGEKMYCGSEAYGLSSHSDWTVSLRTKGMTLERAPYLVGVSVSPSIKWECNNSIYFCKLSRISKDDDM